MMSSVWNTAESLLLGEVVRDGQATTIKEELEVCDDDFDEVKPLRMQHIAARGRRAENPTTTVSTHTSAATSATNNVTVVSNNTFLPSNTSAYNTVHNASYISSTNSNTVSYISIPRNSAANTSASYNNLVNTSPSYNSIADTTIDYNNIDNTGVVYENNNMINTTSGYNTIANTSASYNNVDSSNGFGTESISSGNISAVSGGEGEVDKHGLQAAGPGRGRGRGGRGGRGRSRGSGNGRGRGIGIAKGRGYLPAAVAEGLARHEAVQQLVYKRKYKHMKRIIRQLVLENGALCDAVAETQQRLVVAGEQRRFLLQRLHQAVRDCKDGSFEHLDSSLWARLEAAPQPSPAPATTPTPTVDSRGGGGGRAGKAAGHAAQPPASRRKAAGGHGGSKSKAKRLCPPITLDSAGRPIFPITLGPLTIHSLGEIVCSRRPAYHRSHVIFPVGFCSSRTFASVAAPTRSALYTCKILDGGPRPRFEIVCEDPVTGEERVFGGASPTECHNSVLAAINRAPAVPRGILTLSAPPSTGGGGHEEERGLRFFGLSHPSVQNVLQACPGARKCRDYTWIRFEVCRSESEVEKVLEGEREAGLCHETLLRNIMFATQGL